MYNVSVYRTTNEHGLHFRFAFSLALFISTLLGCYSRVQSVRVNSALPRADESYTANLHRSYVRGFVNKPFRRETLLAFQFDDCHFQLWIVAKERSKTDTSRLVVMRHVTELNLIESGSTILPCDI